MESAPAGAPGAQIRICALLRDPVPQPRIYIFLVHKLSKTRSDILLMMEFCIFLIAYDASRSLGTLVTFR